MVLWKSALFFIFCSLILYADIIVCMEGSRSDFVYENKSLSRISFGSCMNGMFSEQKWHERPQYVWKHVLNQHPDLWVWLGDAAYGDTRLLPFVWTPSPLPLMAKYFRRQKHHPDYQEFLKSNITVVGVWDDHDFGMNDGGKIFENRLQTQDIFLDFLDEPLDSIRRKREGVYVSYTFGLGEKALKLIMLDVRSFAVFSKFGSSCDMLGDEQWSWLTRQLDDPTPVAFTIVTSGIQILSNSIPGIQSWKDCPHSYDRLIWLTRSRNKTIYLSGDVHFGETSCLNSSSSGYPLYEVTSSSLYMTCTVPILSEEMCRWAVRNVVGNDFRITETVVERNFGLLKIDWDSKPVNVKLQIFGEQGYVVSEVGINLDHITRRLAAERCPDAKRPKATLVQIYIFWAAIGLILLTPFLVFIIVMYFICKLLFFLIRSFLSFSWRPSNVSKIKQKRS